MDISLKIDLADVVLFSSVVLVSIIIGLYFANKNKTMSDYMLGNKNMGIFPVSMSMMTSFLSGITLIASPAEIYSHGWGYAIIGLTCLTAGPLSAYWIVPVFYNCNYLSIYQYLEDRYDRRVRTMISTLFMFQMLLYNAMVLFIPSLALQAVTGIDSKYMILGVGLSCSIYATLGGIKSVIWTDLFQGSLMIISMLVIAIKGTMDAGGFSEVWSVAKEGGRLPDDVFNFDLTTRHTILCILVGGTIQNTYLLAANQIQVQRALTLSTIERAQAAIVLSGPISCLVVWLACYNGFIVYYNYKNCDPIKSGNITREDEILPFYVVERLKIIPGLCGLFIAGIFCATLSTLSSFSNSMAAIMVDDVINPMRITPMNDRQATIVSKCLALFFGLLCMLMSFVVQHITGLLQSAVTLLGAIGAPFFVAFVLGMHTKFCNSTGIISGLSVSIVLGIIFQLGQQFIVPPPVQLPTKILECPNYYQLVQNVSSLETDLVEATGCRRIKNGCDMISDVVKFEQEQIQSSFDNNFNIFEISYMWFPVISLVLTTVIACIVSLLTGGRRQYVNEKCLFSQMKKTKAQTENFRSGHLEMFG